jgi:hypothetical protein
MKYILIIVLFMNANLFARNDNSIKYPEYNYSNVELELHVQLYNTKMKVGLSQPWLMTDKYFKDISYLINLIYDIEISRINKNYIKIDTLFLKIKND